MYTKRETSWKSVVPVQGKAYAAKLAAVDVQGSRQV